MLFCLLLHASHAATIGEAVLKGDALSGKGVEVYRGIRYATAGRWRAPQPFQYAAGVYDMHAHGHQCPQMSKNRGKWQLTMIENPSVPESEDCLNLVIYQPKRDGPQPVLIYLHGGNFVTGSNAMAMQDFTQLAQSQGVVVVVPNYRLGVLGFTMDPTLPADKPNGNWGMMDVEMAADWVKNNIAAFGGDPQRVTLMGHSAGAMIGHLLSITRTNLPWQQLYLGSGTRSTKPSKGRQEAMEEVQSVGRILGAKDSLKSDSLMAWLKAWDPLRMSMTLYNAGGRLVYAPILDGVYLTDQYHQLAIPTMFTWTRDDGSFFVPRDLLPDESKMTYIKSLHGLFPKVATRLPALYPFDDKASNTLSVVLTDMIFRKPALHWSRQASNAHAYEFQEGLHQYLKQPLEGIAQGGIFHNCEIPLLNGTYGYFEDGEQAKEPSNQWQNQLGAFIRDCTMFGEPANTSIADQRETLWMTEPWPVDMQLAKLRYPKA